MKNALPVLIALVCLVPLSGYALVGGPWGNDSHLSGKGDGTYQGTMRGKSGTNLTGNFFFIWKKDQGSTGRFGVWHEGTTRFGEMQAVVDNAARIISAVFASAAHRTITGTVQQTNDAEEGHGAFIADVVSQAPTYRFVGEGQYNSPGNQLSDNETSVTETVTTTETTTSGNVTIETVTETQTETTTLQRNDDYVEFDVVGVRTSTSATLFTGSALNPFGTTSLLGGGGD